jgi:hypothetical protein
LDDRIKELCSKAVATPPSPELEKTLEELKKALREHTERLRKTAALYPFPPERRRSAKQI